jgi:hypothetical protein
VVCDVSQQSPFLPEMPMPDAGVVQAKFSGAVFSRWIVHKEQGTQPSSELERTYFLRIAFIITE